MIRCHADGQQLFFDEKTSEIMIVIFECMTTLVIYESNIKVPNLTTHPRSAKLHL